MRPYFSLDIETTGLNLDKSVPVQIGIVYDNGGLPLEHLQTLNIIIKRDSYDYAEPKALAMNAKYFDIMTDKAHPTGATQYLILKPAEAYEKMLRFINECKGTTNYITIAGKNVGNYDMPIILNDMKKNISEDKYEGFKKMVRHRYLDVGSMYSTFFGYNPTLDEINQKLGYKAVSHDALDDAKNVVYAIRCAEYNVSWNE